MTPDVSHVTTSSLPEQLVLAYGAFERLGWIPQWTHDGRLVGTSRKERKGPIDMIIVDTNGGDLHFRAALPGGAEAPAEMQHERVAAFSPVISELAATAGAEERAAWRTALGQLHADTQRMLAEQEADEAALAQAMPYTKHGYWVTYGIIAANALVFLLMAISGAGVFEPSGEALVKWGANFAPYTLAGEPWRLLTACFVHIGIFHLVLNMYGLYQLGTFLEPILGRARYLLTYLATGLLSSLASLWWHRNEAAVSAGASGAIFGLFGLFLALLTTDLLPKKVRSRLLGSISAVIVINLLYGMKGGVDNSAHIGGFIAGFVCGYALLPTIRRKSAGTGVAAALLVAAIALCGFYVAAHPDNRLRWEQQEQRVVDLEKRALAQPARAAASWDSARTELQRARYSLPPDYARRRSLFQQYIDLRIREDRQVAPSLRGEAPPPDSVEATKQAIESVLQQLNARP
ncbi:rhomboid family intramembrane serine protease [Flaviaesturariibacter terrae]